MLLPHNDIQNLVIKQHKLFYAFCSLKPYVLHRTWKYIKEIKSATMNIFRKNSFLFKSCVKAELSLVFTINLFTIAENCMEKWIIL